MKKYNLKKISVILIILSFGLLGLTGGLISFFGREFLLLGVPITSIHSGAAKLFILMVGFHIYTNWRILANYIGVKND